MLIRVSSEYVRSEGVRDLQQGIRDVNTTVDHDTLETNRDTVRAKQSLSFDLTLLEPNRAFLLTVTLIEPIAAFLLTLTLI